MKKQPQTLDANSCPVPDDMLGRLYHAPEERIVQTVSTLPAIQRARLAIFCYGRAHLSEMGLAIASTCERETLVELAHRVGEALYQQSRERPKQAPERVVYGRRNITLASSVSWEGAARPVFEDAPEDIAIDDTPAEVSEAAEACDIAQADRVESAEPFVEAERAPAMAVGF